MLQMGSSVVDNWTDKFVNIIIITSSHLLGTNWIASLRQSSEYPIRYSVLSSEITNELSNLSSKVMYRKQLCPEIGRWGMIH